MRMITELAALATAFSGSLDSAAAMVATSAPVIEKITVTIAAVIPITPNGRNPPWAVKLEKSIDVCGHIPNTYAASITRSMSIAKTLIQANDFLSNDKEYTENKFVNV